MVMINSIIHKYVTGLMYMYVSIVASNINVQKNSKEVMTIRTISNYYNKMEESAY